MTPRPLQSCGRSWISWETRRRSAFRIDWFSSRPATLWRTYSPSTVATDEAWTLAKGAVDAGDALLRDESALADEGTFIRVHQAVAESFVVMAEVSNGAGDDDATTLWLSRVAEEGRALSSRQTDRRSVLAGARALYLAGQCPDAYAQALDLLHADPDDREALQMLIRIASLRRPADRAKPGSTSRSRPPADDRDTPVDRSALRIHPSSLDALIADRDSALLLDPIQRPC